LTNFVPAYFVTMALIPEMKYKYFENEWEERPDWIEGAKSMVQKIWERDYKRKSTGQNETLLPIAITMRPPPAEVTLTDSLSGLGNLPDWKRKKRERLIGDCRDELDRYLARETEDDLHAGPLQYWIDHVDDLRQKNLAQMALDTFAIPAMSAEPERLFSR